MRWWYYSRFIRSCFMFSIHMTPRVSTHGASMYVSPHENLIGWNCQIRPLKFSTKSKCWEHYRSIAIHYIFWNIAFNYGTFDAMVNFVKRYPMRGCRHGRFVCHAMHMVLKLRFSFLERWYYAIILSMQLL